MAHQHDALDYRHRHRGLIGVESKGADQGPGKP